MLARIAKRDYVSRFDPLESVSMLLVLNLGPAGS